jgi:hypothetical protein
MLMRRRARSSSREIWISSRCEPSVGERDARFDGSPQGVGLLKYLSNQMMGKFACLSHCSPS